MITRPHCPNSFPGDVDQLPQVGLVTIETKVLPGHGHMKEVRASAGIFRLEAIVV